MQAKMRAAIKSTDSLPAVCSSNQGVCIRSVAIARRLRVGANASADQHMAVGPMQLSVAQQQWHPVTARLVACSATGSSESAGSGVQLEVKVDGMKCGGCSSRVEEALKGMQHVKTVQVDLDNQMATLQVEAATQKEALDMLPGFIATIKDLGFDAEAAGRI